MLEDTPHLAVEVGHGFFVMNIQYPARQNFVPVLDHAIVFLVVHAELDHVVGEILPLTE